MNKQLNFWELCELAKEMLTDVGLIDNEEFHNETLSVTSLPGYASVTKEPILSIHLTNKGFDMFMEHVRARAEQIGEEVREPIETPMKPVSTYTRVSWLGVPGVEFLKLIDKPVAKEEA